MEEIDIVELLKRVKEGKAPKIISIWHWKFKFNENYTCMDDMYINEYGDNLFYRVTEMDTKIKIPDKPIIEEIEIPKDDYADPNEVAKKINEIIRYLNKEGKYGFR